MFPYFILSGEFLEEIEPLQDFDFELNFFETEIQELAGLQGKRKSLLK